MHLEERKISKQQRKRLKYCNWKNILNFPKINNGIYF